MELKAGQTVLHYKLTEKLGEGGMGQVWKAWDSRLNRNVAIKALRNTSTSGTDRQRFLQEARAASALNHPNIVTIYDIFSEEGADFLVMEFVSGQTLAQIIPKGGLRVGQALPVVVQIADALATAHEAGIVHRDLKPGNVMVTQTGIAKLLDFGLAKLTMAVVAESDETATAMAAQPLTVVGSVMGTARYMSPEQAEGLTVDARSDIFTFGVVLYEMLTGTSAFQGATTMSTLAAVIRDEPRSLSELTTDLPPALDELIQQSMRKNRDSRLPSMREMHRGLTVVLRSWESATAPAIAPATVTVPPAVPAPASLPPTVPAAKPAAASPTPPVPSAAKPAAPKAKQAPASKNNLALAAVVVAAVIIGGVWFNISRQQQPAAEPPPPVVEETPPPAPPVAETPPPAPEPAPAVELSKTKQTVAKAKKTTLQTPLKTPETKAAPAQSAAQETRSSATSTAPAAPPPPAAARQTIFSVPLLEGTPVQLELDADVRVGATVGDAVAFRVTSDVLAGGHVLIAKGSAAKGIIASAEKKGILRRGKMTMSMDTAVAVDGKQVRLRETSGKQRKPRVVEPFDRKMRSKDDSIEAPRGALYIGYVDNTIPVDLKK